jgi:D-alanyl-lipoteichoic acid acyltransferase DltB (MBOAT superfamily)
MLFNSLTFVLFFCVVLALQRRLPHRAQNVFLLAASLFFYGSWNATLVWLIVFSATVDYGCGRAIEARRGTPLARRFLLLSIATNLGLLGWFKYAGFFVESFVDLAQSVGLSVGGPALEIILPVGISFYTFQSMSYSIDVYRGEQRACRDYLDFLLYVSFFPQLVAGPIERARRLLPQIQEPRPRLGLGDTVEGIKLIAVGVLQKVAIADALARTVDRTFARPAEMDTLALVLGVYAFAVQIYCDFSGYSKIARGTARLLGIRLVRNFDEPYLAASITDFWRRWHVSLSAWLRDYLYIPLGGNRKGAGRTYVNLMVTMLLGGLWHGASWNFVLWGGLHGLYLAGHKLLGRESAGASPVKRVLGTLATFHLVCFAWIFFRAETFADAGAYVAGLFSGGFATSAAQLEVLFYLGASLALDVLLSRRRRADGTHRLLFLFSRRWVVETTLVTGLLLLALLVGENDVVPFVYFQF